jgi:hypothetical protein
VGLEQPIKVTPVALLLVTIVVAVVAAQVVLEVQRSHTMLGLGLV